MIPHKYEKETAQIEALSNEDISELKVFELIALAMPYGVAAEVAETTGIPRRTLQSWRIDPELLNNSGALGDPNGRRGLGYQFTQFLFALNAVFPAGARLFHKWEGLKLAEAEAIQGNAQRQEAVKLVAQMSKLSKEFNELQKQLAKLTANGDRA